jgi:transcriptional regulator of acetoin/glycerol metabolism
MPQAVSLWPSEYNVLSTSGNIDKVAVVLGIFRSSLYRRVKKYGLQM